MMAETAKAAIASIRDESVLSLTITMTEHVISVTVRIVSVSTCARADHTLRSPEEPEEPIPIPAFPPPSDGGSQTVARREEDSTADQPPRSRSKMEPSIPTSIARLTAVRTNIRGPFTSSTSPPLSPSPVASSRCSASSMVKAVMARSATVESPAADRSTAAAVRSLAPRT